MNDHDEFAVRIRQSLSRRASDVDTLPLPDLDQVVVRGRSSTRNGPGVRVLGLAAAVVTVLAIGIAALLVASSVTPPVPVVEPVPSVAVAEPGLIGTQWRMTSFTLDGERVDVSTITDVPDLLLLRIDAGGGLDATICNRLFESVSLTSTTVSVVSGGTTQALCTGALGDAEAAFNSALGGSWAISGGILTLRSDTASVEFSPVPGTVVEPGEMPLLEGTEWVWDGRGNLNKIASTAVSGFSIHDGKFSAVACSIRTGQVSIEGAKLVVTDAAADEPSCDDSLAWVDQQLSVLLADGNTSWAINDGALLLRRGDRTLRYLPAGVTPDTAVRDVATPGCPPRMDTVPLAGHLPIQYLPVTDAVVCVRDGGPLDARRVTGGLPELLAAYAQPDDPENEAVVSSCESAEYPDSRTVYLQVGRDVMAIRAPTGCGGKPLQSAVDAYNALVTEPIP